MGACIYIYIHASVCIRLYLNVSGKCTRMYPKCIRHVSVYLECIRNVSVCIRRMYPNVSVCIRLYPKCIRLYPFISVGRVQIYIFFFKNISVYSKCRCLISACVRFCSCHFDVSCLLCIGISVCVPLLFQKYGYRDEKIQTSAVPFVEKRKYYQRPLLFRKKGKCRLSTIFS